MTTNESFACDILVVDDEPDIRAYLARILATDITGARVRTAGNGAEALALLAERSADLVLSDQRMPGMSGVEFLTRSIEIAPDAARMLLTGYADVETAMDAKNDGHVSAFLQKPAGREIIVAEARRLLDASRARRLRERAFGRASDALRNAGGGSLP